MKKYEEYKNHVFNTINNSSVDFDPFGHLYIENIFPQELYNIVKDKAYYYKYNKNLKARTQDNKNFVNKKYNLFEDQDIETQYIRNIFSSPEIKNLILNKFFMNVSENLVNDIEIHKEFEYTFTEKNKFQNIHVDIPPKFLSFVFYFPEKELDDNTQKLNSTILYDKNLKPFYKAKFKDNSVCIFAPHLYSYHGFNTTIDRAALVMFYINKSFYNFHDEQMKKKSSIETFKNVIVEKLKKYSLIEYKNLNMNQEYDQCKINAPEGRVLIE